MYILAATDTFYFGGCKFNSICNKFQNFSFYINFDASQRLSSAQFALPFLPPQEINLILIK